MSGKRTPTQGQRSIVVAVLAEVGLQLPAHSDGPALGAHADLQVVGVPRGVEPELPPAVRVPAIGAAERTLEIMIKRAMTREAFGRPIAKLGGNPDVIANARMNIEQARLLTLKCAWALDTKGIMGALQEVSMIKAVVPAMLQQIVDDAIQIHGGAGVSDDDFPLTALFGYARVLRLADGPDEVHRAMVARLELRKYKS